METFKVIDEAVYSASDKIIRVKKNPLRALPLILIGFALVVASYMVQAISSSPNLSSAAVLLGSVIALVGVCRLLIFIFGNSATAIHKPSGSKLLRYELYFNSMDKERVCEYVRSGNFDKLEGLIQSESSAIMVVVYKTIGNDILLAQVFEFVPHVHVPITDTLVFNLGEYRPLNKLIA